MGRTAKTTVRAHGKWQGSHWIRNDKRLAIILRDGLACAYCGAAVEQGTQLSVDHVHAFIRGGKNDGSNLITSCFRCNSSKGSRSLRAFAKAVSAYIDHGVSAASIIKHVARCTARPLAPFRDEAKRMLARRGTAAKVLASLVNKETVKSRHVKTGIQK